MPLAESAPATSLSNPAQPPSPDRMMAKASEGVAPGSAGTVTIGRSLSVFGRGVATAPGCSAISASIAAAYGGVHNDFTPPGAAPAAALTAVFAPVEASLGAIRKC